ENTKVGNGVIIDNQGQIAHNVIIGDNSAIAGCSAIAGSTHIGQRCTISGGVGIIGHLTIVDDVHVTAMSLVSKSIHKAGSYSSGTGLEATDKWRKSAVRVTSLYMFKRLSKPASSSGWFSAFSCTFLWLGVFCSMALLLALVDSSVLLHAVNVVLASNTTAAIFVSFIAFIAGLYKKVA
ncbi:hypothetical protein OA79_17795, partial [Marinomonas sp. TW1]